MTSEKASAMSKTAKKEILKGDGSLEAFFSRLLEKFKVCWTPKRSGYQMETIGVKDDLRRGIRNDQNEQKGDFQKRQES